MVMTGEFWAGASGRGIADGVRELGWAVQEVDHRDFRVRGGSDVLTRVANRWMRRSCEIGYRQKLLEECRELKPDVFLTIKGVGLTKQVLRWIKETGARTIMYYPDRDFDHSGVSTDGFDEYDLFITTKTFQREYLERLLGQDRVAYVPHGYVSEIHRPVFDSISEQDYRVDLLYPGNHCAYKQKWLEETLANLPESSVEIVGNRWCDNASKDPLSRCRIAGARIGVAYAEAIQTARVNISLHFGPAASGWKDLVSTRTFEIPACKGFMLHIDNEEVREFFTPGKEIDVFSTPEELAEKSRFYLARPDLRARMIERAYARTVPGHSYAERAKKIVALFEGRLAT